MMTFKPILASLAIVGGIGLAASDARAAEDTPSIVSYGFNGFWTGAQIGLATGYLATGDDYESREWRKLVFGAGIGALVGVAGGLTLGIVDVGQAPPRTGYLILRDMGYGVGLGAVVGIAVGALFVIDSGRPKDLLIGGAWGTVIGGGAGIAFGVIEGAAADRATTTTALNIGGDVKLTLVGAEGSWIPVPGLVGTF